MHRRAHACAAVVLGALIGSPGAQSARAAADGLYFATPVRQTQADGSR